MNRKPEFDDHAQKYEDHLTQVLTSDLEENAYYAEYKIALVASVMKKTLSSPKRILDFGCGTGRSLPYLATYFPCAQIWGYDPSTESLLIAGRRAPQANLRSDWKDIPSAAFDIVVAANVFHHIDPHLQIGQLANCRAALSEQGKMFMFEHNPLNPATRWVFDSCPLDVGATMIKRGRAVEIAKLAGLRTESYAYTLFFPRAFSYLRRYERWLGRLPFGAQYYVQMAK